VASTAEVGHVSTTATSLDRAVRSGLKWSAANSLVLRLCSLLLGILLARILTPEEFGTFAVALTVQTLVMSLGDLGLGTQLIRTRDFEGSAPTIAALGALSGLALAGAMVAFSPWIATVMGSPDSAAAIAVLGVTVAFGGLGVVPFALIQREIRQRLLLLITAADFLVSTSVTLTLVLIADQGALGLAIGRLAGQTTATLLMFLLTKRRPTYAWDPSQMVTAARFGLPIAGANVLSWATLGLPTAVIARDAGAAQLGLYVLAFNVSSWPMTALGQAVRSVALPGFSRTLDGDQVIVLRRSLRLTWTVALPVGVALAVLAEPLILTLYGAPWRGAWTVLAVLGVFGSLRVAFDMFASFLLAHGQPRRIFVVQTTWFAMLLPALLVGVRFGGILGAALAQLFVVVLVALPLYLQGLRRVGISLRVIARPLVRPTLATSAAAAAGWAVTVVTPAPAIDLVVGGLVGAVVYAGVMHRQLLDDVHANRAHDLGPQAEQTTTREGVLEPRTP
jgi:lipopolysaccharide exporter